MSEIIKNEKTGETEKALLLSSEADGLLTFIKEELSKELPTLTIDLDYFMLGVLAQKDNDLYRRLDSCITSTTLEHIYNSFFQVVSSKALTAIKGNRVPKYDQTLSDILTASQKEAADMDSDRVTTEHIFLAILNSEDNEKNKIKKLFNKAGLTYDMMKSKMSENTFSTKEKPHKTKQRIVNLDSPIEIQEFVAKIMPPEPDGFDSTVDSMFSPRRGREKKTNIASFCTNLNDLAKEGKIEPLIGRDREINEIIRILGRRKKNNAILLGGEGVGKTAIGEALALKIINGDVPDFLLSRRIVSLDMTALMAGTTLRGMFEERVKGILDEIKNDPSYILFMDNIGAILADKGKNDYEISAMLSTALEKGDIQVIGTSDYKSYRKTFDKDPSLARRFQKIVVDAPSVSDSLEILKGLKPSYEGFHKVVYDDDAIAACVTMANRYISERNLPDSAIDILDEAGALIGTIQDSDELKELRVSISEKEKEEADLKAKKSFKEMDAVQSELKALKKQYYDAKEAFDKERAEHPLHVTKEDILGIVSVKTNIPINNLTSDDRKRLANMNERIKSEIVGQDEAIDTVCKALKRNRVGLHKNGCMYSCMAIGKTGTGKTLMAKKLAKELFGDEKALVRFDMSEFSDKVAVNKLIGSNPGYVGYEEGGQLTEMVKNKKHCVLLLDEIEKADPEIYNIFLQVLDEGFLTDNSGQKVDFKNVIVIFTSNVGAKTASEFGKGIGFKENEAENTKKILLKQLKGRFPPEFLNRIDDVIYFNSLTDDNLRSIIRLEMSKLEENLSSIGYKMTYTDDAVDYILGVVNGEKEFGARPIVRAIQDTIEDKITDALLEHDYDSGYEFTISCLNSEVTVA